MSDESSGREVSVVLKQFPEDPPKSMLRSHFSRVNVKPVRKVSFKLPEPSRKRKHSAVDKENVPIWLHRSHFSRINVSRSANKGITISFLESARKLPRFSADELAFPVEAWVARVAEDARIYGWSTRETLIAAKWALTGSAEVWYRYQRYVYTWQELRSRLLEEFHRPLSKPEAQELLSKRRKRREERVLSYVFEMEAIGRLAGISQKEVRMHIVNGVSDNDVNKAMLLSLARRKDFKHALMRVEYLWNNEPIFKNSL